MPKTALRTVALLFVLMAFAWVRQASAQYTNLVTDGTFGQVSLSSGQSSTGLTTLYGQFGTGYLTVAGWSTTGYNFVYAPNTVDQGTGTGGAFAGQPKEAPGQYTVNGYGNQYMWGSHNGGTAAWPATDPAGGDFIAADGTYESGAITQTITGLKVGEAYALKFYWGAAQQQSYTGSTTEWWSVSLGGETESTSTFSLASGSFSGWMQDTMYFTATSATETLSFLAGGTPNGQPPFSLLGGVSLEVVPDFSNWMAFASFGGGCMLLEAGRRRRRQKKSGPPPA
ncbi:MAG TPA: hypothetical protein VHY22_14410 [Chthoniobacteraceae bacterium]|jgi:hypothetical protein|nr:hypothetical protein [Chthoniobacteraceae bacterium]